MTSWFNERKFGQRRLKLISFCQSEKNRHWPLYTKALDTKKSRMIECGVMINWLATHCLSRLQCRLNSEVATKKVETKNTLQTPQGERKSDWSKKPIEPWGIKNMHINGYSVASLIVMMMIEERNTEQASAFLAFQQSDFLSLLQTLQKAIESWLHFVYYVLMISGTKDRLGYIFCSM